MQTFETTSIVEAALCRRSQFLVKVVRFTSTEATGLVHSVRQVGEGPARWTVTFAPKPLPADYPRTKAKPARW